MADNGNVVISVDPSTTAVGVACVEIASGVVCWGRRITSTRKDLLDKLDDMADQVYKLLLGPEPVERVIVEAPTGKQYATARSGRTSGLAMWAFGAGVITGHLAVRSGGLVELVPSSWTRSCGYSKPGRQSMLARIWPGYADVLTDTPGEKKGMDVSDAVWMAWGWTAHYGKESDGQTNKKA